jgi:hypothetical protein
MLINSNHTFLYESTGSDRVNRQTESIAKPDQSPNRINRPNQPAPPPLEKPPQQLHELPQEERRAGPFAEDVVLATVREVLKQMMTIMVMTVSMMKMIKQANRHLRSRSPPSSSMSSPRKSGARAPSPKRWSSLPCVKFSNSAVSTYKATPPPMRKDIYWLWHVR